jgi:excisionase family DNA binding protein
MTRDASIEPLTVAVPEAAAVLGISRSHAYELAHTGELPTVRLGRRIVVPTAALLALLRADPVAAPRAPLRPCQSNCGPCRPSVCASSSAASVVATCTSCGSTACA